MDKLRHLFARKLFSTLGVALGVIVALIGFGMVFSFFSKSDLVPERTEVEVASNAVGLREMAPETAPVILRIDLRGIIGDIDLDTRIMDDLLADSRKGVLGDRVKAILLYIDSPGGAASDSDDIYSALLAYKERYKIPIYAYVDGLCASGGMFIACAADRILATPGSVIGSVGVILGPRFNFSGAMDKYGIQSLTITEGLDKDALNPFRPWKPGEDGFIRAIASGTYDRFVGIVSQARPQLTREKLVHDYGAHVFIAKTAQENGYVDSSESSYADALNQLATAAHISLDEPYQVFLIKPTPSLATLLSKMSNSLASFLPTLPRAEPPLPLSHRFSGKVLYLYPEAAASLFNGR